MSTISQIQNLFSLSKIFHGSTPSPLISASSKPCLSELNPFLSIKTLLNASSQLPSKKKTSSVDWPNFDPQLIRQP
jgi:hypothetical protein